MVRTIREFILESTVWTRAKFWVQKAAITKLKAKQNLVMLIPARTDTSYWHDYIFNHAEIRFLRGRLKFEVGGVGGDSAPFPSAIVIYKGDGDDD
ncbi:phage N-6-adenine-methyltransferase [Lactiplantibacillus plantarum]|uniref:phage N-6-adenine-methyltransferase n=1 Tax=Lactiplantibacillus plantarum TaxID=1590 RepID=UPI0021CB6416|nr:phage N-6-adenine-methyltransferase [Lactiplantibacillus plantarum]